MHRWRTLSNGQLEVNGRVPLLSGEARSIFRAQVLERWGELASRHAAAAGVAVAWVLGMIWAESGGNPNARSPDGGFGLMQLTSRAALDGHTGAEVLADPSLNIELGSRLIARLMHPSDSLVEVASEYNAGATASGRPHAGGEPWGYRETPGHIARVVAASNTAIALGAETVADDEIGPSGTLALPSVGPVPFGLFVAFLRWLR